MPRPCRRTTSRTSRARRTSPQTPRCPPSAAPAPTPVARVEPQRPDQPVPVGRHLREIPAGSTTAWFATTARRTHQLRRPRSTYVPFDLPSRTVVTDDHPRRDSDGRRGRVDSTPGVTGVSFSVDRARQSIHATRCTPCHAPSSSANALTGVVAPTATCGFATPGTGTYASTLCFVDFSSYNYQIDLWATARR